MCVYVFGIDHPVVHEQALGLLKLKKTIDAWVGRTFAVIIEAG